jgi:cation diffusion facilitator family transporter
MLLDNRSTVRRVLLITLLLNLVVMGIKITVGFLTGSLSLFADALHSVTDSLNNVLGLFAIKFASPYPDRDHPYGHQKFEAVMALGIAAFLGIACFEILQGAVMRAIEGFQKGLVPLTIGTAELWILLIVLGINIFVTFYERREGVRVGSAILVADAQHTMSDVWVTMTVMAGLIGSWWGNQINVPQLQWLDVFLSFPVAMLVFHSGWSVLQDNLPSLVDQMAIDPEIIQQLTLEVPGVLNCHSIASRGIVGRQIFIEMHLIVDAQDVATAHAITEAVEQKLEEQFPPARILIHVEPPDYTSDAITY